MLMSADNGRAEADERDGADNDGGYRPVLREVLERIAEDLAVIEAPRQGEGHPPQLAYCEHRAQHTGDDPPAPAEK